MRQCGRHRVSVKALGRAGGVGGAASHPNIEVPDAGNPVGRLGADARGLMMAVAGDGLLG